jgi:diguanylate cyclase (GGDEF)-like protein
MRVRYQAAASARDADNLAAVAAATHQLSGRTEADSARPAICEAAIRVSGATGATLWEPTADSAALTVSASVGAELTESLLHFVGRPAGATRAFASGEALFVPDVAEYPEISPAGTDAGAVSCFWQPVTRDGSPIGVLGISWQERIPELSEHVSAVLRLLASEAGAAMERADLLARLEAVARTDDLTGLPNRRAWEEELPRELARAQRDERPLSVAMLDLDHFKAFNDRRGHQAGDRLLKQAASDWAARLRIVDVLARYGGEEFALALPGCRLEDALPLLETLRAATPAGQTCSAGVACWDGEESIDELLGRADAALYAAKRAGRNRTVTAVGGDPASIHG